MTGRQRITAWVTLGVVVALVLGAFAVQKDKHDRSTPDYQDPGQQPSEGLAASMGVLTDAESLAANGVSPMSGCCTGYTAGYRVRRRYPGHLLECPDSLIHVGIDAGVDL